MPQKMSCFTSFHGQLRISMAFRPLTASFRIFLCNMLRAKQHLLLDDTLSFLLEKHYSIVIENQALKMYLSLIIKTTLRING